MKPLRITIEVELDPAALAFRGRAAATHPVYGELVETVIKAVPMEQRHVLGALRELTGTLHYRLWERIESCA
jgi:hypothetical protein